MPRGASPFGVGRWLTTITGMDVSSSLSDPKEFRIVKRGYDPDEVDAFLDQIALGVAELKRKLAEAGDAAKAAPAPAAAPEASEAGADERGDEIQRALILASRAADDELRKANEEAESIRTEAQAAADEARQSAEADAAAERTAIEEEIARRREEGRAGLLAEISELESVRDSLAGDVVVLERHVDEQREVVQAAIGELQSLLDHPEAFRIAMASGVTTPLPVPEAAPVVEDRPEVPVGADRAQEPALVDDEPGSDESAEDPTPITPQDLVAATQDDPGVEERSPLDADDRGATAMADDGDTSSDAADEGQDPPADPVLLDESGPSTEAVAAVGDPDSEDAFLAELRKAMLDDEPLGPRDQGEPDLRQLEPPAEDDLGRGRSRFGRRR